MQFTQRSLPNPKQGLPPRHPTRAIPGTPTATRAPSDETATTTHLAGLRSEYEFHAGRSIALPLAGAAVWAIIGVAALILPERTSTIALMFGTGAIFPVALVLARLLRERLLDNPSPLAGLMGRSVFMVNLLWAAHLTVYARVPELLPLTLGIGLGLHWVVFGWVIGHHLGVVHAGMRTVLVVTMWWTVPGARISAVAAAVVMAYAYSIVALMTRTVTARSARSPDAPSVDTTRSKGDRPAGATPPRPQPGAARGPARGRTPPRAQNEPVTASVTLGRP